MNLKEKTTLQSGKYRIIRVLGQGGFGITYLAVDTTTGRFIAIKEFFPKDFCGRDNTSQLIIGTVSNQETVRKLKDRFLKEARNCSRLNHPGIVKIHEIFEENNTAYYVMDYIEGENLNEMVKRNGALNEKTATEYIKKVAEALDYIHSQNMTHFDVKPANIVVRKSDNQPILIDFGLSKQYDMSGEVTSTLMHAVSHGFSPIELYNAQANLTFSPQTDAYSLGATYYFLLTGNIPPNASELTWNPLSFPASISVKPKELIKTLMRPNRNERPTNLSPLFSFHSSTSTEDRNSYNSSQIAEDTRVLSSNGDSIDNNPSLHPAPVPSVKKKSNKGLWITIAVIAVIIVGILIGKDTIIHAVTGRPSDTFTDRSKLRIGNYIYDSDGFFAHGLVQGYRPTARVVSTNFGIKCISLIPLGESNFANRDNYISSASSKYKNVHIPTNEEMKEVSEKLYDLHWEGKTGVCPWGGAFVTPKHHYSTWDSGSTHHFDKEMKMEKDLGKKFWLSSSETVNVTEDNYGSFSQKYKVSVPETHAKYWSFDGPYKIMCLDVTNNPSEKLPVIYIYDL